MLRFIRERVRGRHKKLLHDYIAIFFIMGTVLFLSFFVIGYIADSTAMGQSRGASRVIYKQAREQMEQFEEDLANMQMNVVKDESVLCFLEASDVYERLLALERVQGMVGMNRRINRNLENIIFYDEGGNLIFALGNVFLDKPDLELNEMLNFSGRMWDDASKQACFEVGLPVYKEDVGGYTLLGSAYLLFNVGNLQDIVNRALLNEESAIALVDGSGRAIVKAGKWEDYYGEYEADMEDKSRLVYAEYVGATGWRIVNVIPKKALLSGASQMRKITYVAFFAMVSMMVFLCAMLYKHILYPISRQIAFMEGFTKDTHRRIEVLEDNEIGDLARKMNQMLDDIEKLNGEIIESNRKFLEMEYAKKQTEMIAYRSQINPHFLYNTLETIRMKAFKANDREVARAIKLLGKSMRYVLENTGTSFTTLSKELEHIKVYLDIQKLRFTDKFDSEIEVMEDIDPGKLLILPLLLQPVVENAILHGLEEKEKGGLIHILVRKQLEEEELLCIEVSDNGNGMTEEALAFLQSTIEEKDISRNKSIGLYNINQRIKLTYGQKYGVKIFSNIEEGTRVSLFIPINRMKETAVVTANEG